MRGRRGICRYLCVCNSNCKKILYYNYIYDDFYNVTVKVRVKQPLYILRQGPEGAGS